jgi:hypothetical protein
MSRKTELTKINDAIQRAKKLATKHDDTGYVVYREDESDYVVISYHAYVTQPGYSQDCFVRYVAYDRETKSFDITDR